jgi:hypothetical protein
MPKTCNKPIRCSSSLHLQPDSGYHAGIVQGAVALAACDGIAAEVPIDGLQLVIPQVWEARPAHFEGADVRAVESCSQ